VTSRNASCQRSSRVSLPLLLFLLLVVFCPHTSRLLAQEGTTQSEEAMRAVYKVTAGLAAQNEVEDLAHRKIKHRAEALSDMILADLSNHLEPAQSRPILAMQFDEELRQSLRRSLLQIHDSLNPRDEPDKWFSKRWLVDYVDEHFAQAVETSISENRRLHFETVFGDARQQAAKRQLIDITLDAYPSMDEAEQLIGSGWNKRHRGDLKDRLIDRMAGGKLLLRETVEHLEAAAEKVLKDLEEQFAMQEEALSVEVPASARSREAIADVLERAVEDARTARRREKELGYHLYEIFSTIEQLIISTARMEEKTRFAEFCNTYGLTFTTNEVRECIEDDLRAHTDQTVSFRLVMRSLRLDAAKDIIRDYARGSRDREMTSTFKCDLQQLIDHDPEVRTSFAASESTALRVPFANARAGIMTDQLTSHFPTVVSGQWSVPEYGLLQVHLKSVSELSLDEYMEIPSFMSGGTRPPHSGLLEETRKRLLSLANGLLREGISAFSTQMQIAHRINSTIPEIIRANQDERSIEEWTEFFQQEAQSQWDIQRAAIKWSTAAPESRDVSSRYLQLFDHVKGDIRKTVKDQFELTETMKPVSTQATRPADSVAAEATQQPIRPQTRTEERRWSVALVLMLIAAALILLLILIIVVRRRRRIPRTSVGHAGTGAVTPQGLRTRVSRRRPCAKRVPRWLLVLLVVILLALIALVILLVAGGGGGSGRGLGGLGFGQGDGDGTGEQPCDADDCIFWIILTALPSLALAGILIWLIKRGAVFEVGDIESAKTNAEDIFDIGACRIEEEMVVFKKGILDKVTLCQSGPPSSEP